jgi:prephenate dehydrogenase
MRVTLIGTGLIGGSVGLAIRANLPDVEIIAYDRDPASALRAAERGAAHRADADLADAVRGSDVVFIATPVGAIAETVKRLAGLVREGAVLTDVGSTKSRVVLEVETSLPEGVSFVGGHPMAGSEEEGIDAATPDLFRGAWWILTPTERSKPADYQTLHGLLTTLGARVMALTPGEHDRLMAVVSHVPQLTATTLMNLAASRGRDNAGLLALAAGGFRDVTRIASSNPDIWVDICRENAAAIAEVLTDLADRLLSIRDLIAVNDHESLRTELAAGREARRNLPGKAVDGDLFDIRIAVPDRPGLLAQVTTTVGNLGVNIEDLQITHSSEGGRGTLHLQILGVIEADKVAKALRELDLDARLSAL